MQQLPFTAFWGYLFNGPGHQGWGSLGDCRMCHMERNWRLQPVAPSDLSADSQHLLASYESEPSSKWMPQRFTDSPQPTPQGNGGKLSPPSSAHVNKKMIVVVAIMFHSGLFYSLGDSPTAAALPPPCLPLYPLSCSLTTQTCLSHSLSTCCFHLHPHIYTEASLRLSW